MLKLQKFQEYDMPGCIDHKVLCKVLIVLYITPNNILGKENIGANIAKNK